MSGGPKSLSVFLDVSFYDHPKVIEAGEKADRLYTQALCLAKRTRSDGFVSDEQLKRFGLTQVAARARKLADVGLFHRDDDRSGWWIHDFLEHNRSRAEQEAIIEKRRKAGSKGGRPPKANGKQVANQSAEQAGNPEEVEIEVEKRREENPTTATGDTQDPLGHDRGGGGGSGSPSAGEPNAAELADELVLRLGYVGDAASAGPDLIGYVDRALGRGWPSGDLLDFATEVGAMPPDEIDTTPRKVLLGGIRKRANSDPTVRTSDGRSIKPADPDRVDEILASIERAKAAGTTP